MSVYETSITNPKKQLEFYKDLSEQLQQENEKLNHYKLLYQKVKERNDKAIEYIENNGEKQYNHHDNYRGKWYTPDELDTLDDILKGENNE